MPRATTVLATTTLVGCVASLWLYLENRSLRAQLDDQKPAPAPVATPEVVAHDEPPPPPMPTRRWLAPRPPSLPSQPMPSQEGRLDRRARRTQQMATMFGRADGESDDQYRARVSPVNKAALAIPRAHVVGMRRAGRHPQRDRAAGRNAPHAPRPG